METKNLLLIILIILAITILIISIKQLEDEPFPDSVWDKITAEGTIIGYNVDNFPNFTINLSELNLSGIGG